MKNPLVLLPVLLLLCCREEDNPCVPDPDDLIQIGTYEALGDSTFITDTLYQYRAVHFRAPKNIIQPLWKIGEDPRSFNENNFYLVFNQLGSYQLQLAGSRSLPCANTAEPVNFLGTFVIVPNTTASPLVGKFLGKNAGETAEFAVEIKYWSGSRYPWWENGAYSIDNLPQGYTNSSQTFNGFARPEITGIIVENGFSSFRIDMDGNIPARGINGYGALTEGRQRIEINYKLINQELYDKTGKIEYVKKKYIGMRQPD